VSRASDDCHVGDADATKSTAGPNAISVNSSSAVAPIYANANALDKSDAYVIGRQKGVGIFFILNLQAHSVRRRHWAPAFTAKRSVIISFGYSDGEAGHSNGRRSLREHRSTVISRTEQLIGCLEPRAESAAAIVNLSDFISRWAFDVMVCLNRAK
jgi:hypothetical protein